MQRSPFARPPVRPLANAAEQHTRGYKAEHCNQIKNPVYRSPFSIPSVTPSAPIGVIPSNIASGCDPAIVVIPGLMPRGYTLPSLAGLYLNLKNGNTPILPLSHSPNHPLILSLTNSFIHSPPRKCSGAACLGLQGRAL
jgi:hypothetical protein